MLDVYSLTAAGLDEDLICVGSVRVGDQAVLAVAMGDRQHAGGTKAAQSAVAVALELAAVATAEVLAARLREADHKLKAQADHGLTSLAVVAVSPGRVEGAAVGELGVWLFSAGHIELTAKEERRPLLGSGEARVVPFKTTFSDGTVVVGTPALWRDAGVDTAAFLSASEESAGDLAEALVDAARGADGSLTGPVAVSLARVG